jgi:IS30 family transposase
VQHPADLISASYIDQVSDEEIQDIVITANLTPRKCLGFKTPLGKDVQIRFS